MLGQQASDEESFLGRGVEDLRGVEPLTRCKFAKPVRSLQKALHLVQSMQEGLTRGTPAAMWQQKAKKAQAVLKLLLLWPELAKRHNLPLKFPPDRDNGSQSQRMVSLPFRRFSVEGEGERFDGCSGISGTKIVQFSCITLGHSS